MPTVFIDGPYRFYFFSREEERRHIHVSSSDGEVKIWLEPKIEVAKIVNLTVEQVNSILKVVKKHEEEINDSWNKHFTKN